MPSFECKRLPCLVVRLLISSCPIGTNRTLYPFLHWKSRFCDEMGHFCDEMGHFCTLRPSSARLHAFYLHLTLFACTALIFNALRRVGYSAQCLHTFALPARRLFTPCTGCFFDNNGQQKRLRQVELPVGTTDISTYCKRYNALAQVPKCWVLTGVVLSVQGGQDAHRACR